MPGGELQEISPKERVIIFTYRVKSASNMLTGFFSQHIRVSQFYGMAGIILAKRKFISYNVKVGKSVTF